MFSGRWGVIFAEFVLIVTGIFLGLQADSWFENRQLAESLNIYLERLTKDVGQMTSDLGASRKINLEERDAAVRSLRALENCALLDSQIAEFDQTLARHQVLLSFNITRSTYDEMIAVGAFARIHSLELKDALSHFYSVANSALGFTDYFRADLGRASDIIWRHVSFSTDDLGVGVISDYEFEAICKSTEFKNALVEVVDSRRDWIWQADGMLEILEDLSRLLNNETGLLDEGKSGN